MKPPPRKRTKRTPSFEPSPAPRKVSGQWQLAERRKLLKALKDLAKTNSLNEDIDCEFLRKYVPTRSISEINTMVELLKSQVISFASQELKKKTRQEKDRKPIEVWTQMASLVAGTNENPIIDTFSQILMVCSTEPKTLKFCDPPKVNGPPPVQNRHIGRTAPLKPIPRLPLKVRPIRALKNPAAATSPGGRLAAASHQLLSTAAGASPATPPTSQSAPSEQHPTTTSSSESTSASPHTSPTSRTPAPSPASSSGASSPHPLSTPARKCNTVFGTTSKLACKQINTKESAVDFERIYGYLSVINTPGKPCHLTAMESAIVLDLLMSLPEELLLLDCNKLKKHLLQVHRFLSSTPDSKMARDMLKELKEGLCVQTEGGDGPQNKRPAERRWVS
ncbi:hypothetical protein PBY51_006253 [Eleginops maclovinus]|uniref:snRNA-activating protein complex subunit 2 n=1 Tax=Eleginops maclovinus TaxID=56733 RepID=A0AAN7WWF4_ELEMC|nr:hypothetical protein PBY51_006253 [Eleginops maclovinus]